MKLSNICKYRNEKICVNEIKENDYISTDNMLPNFAGLGELKSFPKVEKVNKYCKNDILLSNIRPYFKKMILSNKESGCSSDVLVIQTIDKNVNPIFLYYRLRNNDFFDYVLLTSKGTKMPRGDKVAIMNYELEIPTIEIQNKIVKVLKKIDNKIEINNQINDNLFNLINLNYNKYLDEVSNSENVGVISVKDLFNFESGIEPGSKNYLKKEEIDTIKFYRVGDMDSKCETFIKKNLANNKILNENDIVVSFDATIGRIGYGLNGSFSTGMKKISVNSKYKNIIDNSIIFAYFNNIDTQHKILENAKGTTILHTGSAINFLNFKYNEELLTKYNKIISVFFQKMKHIKKENENLSNLRDTLLPKLMSGEIDLEDVEI